MAINQNEFNALLAKKGMNKNDLAKALGISREALYRRISNSNFNMDEINIMFDLFGVQETIKALFNRDLTIA